MKVHDVLVVGGGISGASFAFHAARAGRGVLVAEKAVRPGGCLQSETGPSDFWIELGAHTCYNSYGAFLDLLDGCDLTSRLQPRGKPVLRFLEGTRVLAGTNLGSLLRLFRKGELLRALPHWFNADQEGATVRSYYSRLVGERNYERVLRPMLSAVTSQAVDAFPANTLFKKRERRKDVMRSFTLPGGLQSGVEAVLDQPEIEVVPGRTAERIERQGADFVVTFDDGGQERAHVLALAVPPGAAAKLLREVAPECSAEAARIGEAHVDSIGVAVRAEQVSVPYSTFLIPLHDSFHSVVTRDVVPDPAWRGFTFHFRPGESRRSQVRRVTQVLGIEETDIAMLSARHTVLPSLTLDHSGRIDSLARCLQGERLALTGNWFGGLSIEDCVQRSRAEWNRISLLE